MELGASQAFRKTSLLIATGALFLGIGVVIPKLTVRNPVPADEQERQGANGGDAAYSRDVLRRNCAQDVPAATIDDVLADTENGVVTLRWWDGTTQENKRLDVLYEPKTSFAGCSESVKSILKHVQAIGRPQ